MSKFKAMTEARRLANLRDCKRRREHRKRHRLCVLCGTPLASDDRTLMCEPHRMQIKLYQNTRER